MDQQRAEGKTSLFSEKKRMIQQAIVSVAYEAKTFRKRRQL
jgi:hypothetical protein